VSPKKLVFEGQIPVMALDQPSKLFLELPPETDTCRWESLLMTWHPSGQAGTYCLTCVNIQPTRPSTPPRPPRPADPIVEHVVE
jgi:hypothetical protein